jgi:putative cardiolipin synthase
MHQNHMTSIIRIGRAAWLGRAANGLLGCLIAMAAGCTSLQSVELPAEEALGPAHTELWTELEAERSGDWFHLLNAGDEGLEWRLRAIDSASESLDLQTFLWKGDPTGLTIMHHLLKAADRGVRIRILLDDTFTINEDDAIFIIDQHPQIEFRIYNPFERRYNSLALRQLLNAGDFSRLDHRMHNKAMVVDNHVAVVGGRNLADEYFGNHPTTNFRDMEVLVGGAVAESVSRQFDDYWNSGWAFPVDRILARPPPEKDLTALRTTLKEGAHFRVAENAAIRRTAWLAVAGTASSGVAQLHADEPARDNPAAADELPDQVAHALGSWIQGANHELILVSAYLIPTPELEAAIEDAETRGVRVRILTNSLRSNNHTTAHSAYRHHVRRLMDHGADLHEVRALAKDRGVYMQEPVGRKELGLHAKLLLIDRELTFIGSANLDPRSLRLNTEMGLLIRSREFNQLVRDALELDFHERNAWYLQPGDDGNVQWVGDDTVLDEQPASSDVQRIEDWFLGFLPLEDKL